MSTIAPPAPPAPPTTPTEPELEHVFPPPWLRRLGNRFLDVYAGLALSALQLLLGQLGGVRVGGLAFCLLRRLGHLELPLALYVAREVARALDYAHRKTDARGRSLHIVHGDVTCRNVLLSIEGEVKLADHRSTTGILNPVATVLHEVIGTQLYKFAH